LPGQLSVARKIADQYEVIRDVRDRGRTIDGIIKQWFKWVKPNFEKVSWIFLVARQAGF
jgi:uridine kinase